MGKDGISQFRGLKNLIIFNSGWYLNIIKNVNGLFKPNYWFSPVSKLESKLTETNPVQHVWLQWKSPLLCQMDQCCAIGINDVPKGPMLCQRDQCCAKGTNAVPKGPMLCQRNQWFFYWNSRVFELSRID